MSPVPTVIPAERSARAKPTITGTNGESSGTGGYLCQVLPDEVKIVAILDNGAQRVVSGLDGQVGLAEEAQRPHPVNGLGDARRLGQVELTQPVNGLDDLARQLLGGVWLADQHNLDLALGGWVSDPVIEAAAPERVVEFPGPVRGEDHSGRGLCLDGADLRDADLEVRKHLQQERLELVVSPVD